MRTFGLLFSIAVIVAAALISGRYSAHTEQQNGSAVVFVVDRFTGSVVICGIGGCNPLGTASASATTTQ